MTLADLKVGDFAIIKEIKTELSLKRRLFDLGLMKDEVVECVLFSPFKSPILYKIKGAFIALRTSDANEIEVNLVEI